MGLTCIPWSSAEDERLRRLLADGKTAGEVADIMPGRTLAAVKCRIQSLGLKALRPRPDAWTAERNELLRHLWCEEGLSASQIAKRMPGLTPNAVIGRVHRMGMSSASRAENTRAQKRGRPLKSAVERRAKPMLRFGGVSIPKSVIPIETPAPEPHQAGVTLLDRASHQCGWPVNDGNPYLYCGALRHRHKRYCDRHAMTGVARKRAAV